MGGSQGARSTRVKRVTAGAQCGRGTAPTRFCVCSDALFLSLLGLVLTCSHSHVLKENRMRHGSTSSLHGHSTAGQSREWKMTERKGEGPQPQQWSPQNMLVTWAGKVTLERKQGTVAGGIGTVLSGF